MMTPLQIVQLILGFTAVLILIRISFQFGKNSQRLEIFERLLGKYMDKFDNLDKNVNVLLDRSNVANNLSSLVTKVIDGPGRTQ